MKNSNMMRTLAAMSLAISLFAGKSLAGFNSLPAGSFSILTHVDGLCMNPNEFPVVTINANQLANGTAGFLLDGSESASNWLKTLQDAVVSNRSVVIWTDDNWAHALCGRITENGYTGGAYKILAVGVSP
jgi:hypothetical protein